MTIQDQTRSRKTYSFYRQQPVPVPAIQAIVNVNSGLNANFQVAPANASYVGYSGMTASRTVTLPSASVSGQEVIVKDEDGSLANWNITVQGNGNNIDGASSYTMTGAKNGTKGSITMIFRGTSTGWSLV